MSNDTQEKEQTLPQYLDESYNAGIDDCIKLTSQSFEILEATIGVTEATKFYQTYNTLTRFFAKLKKKIQ